MEKDSSQLKLKKSVVRETQRKHERVSPGYNQSIQIFNTI